jgi:hypothetical protein
LSPENAMQDHYDRMNDARDAEFKEVRLAALRPASRYAGLAATRSLTLEFQPPPVQSRH